MVVGGDASAVLLLAMMMMFYFTLSISSLKSMIFLSQQIFFKIFHVCISGSIHLIVIKGYF